jgi:hypothetical protein
MTLHLLAAIASTALLNACLICAQRTYVDVMSVAAGIEKSSPKKALAGSKQL